MQSERSYKDKFHPYIDSYNHMRATYLHWHDTWENKLNDMAEHGIHMYELNDICEGINDFIYDSEFLHFYIAEGDDGIFAQEIYQYILKFHSLQGEIRAWRPKREQYYNVTFFFKTGILYALPHKRDINDNITYVEARKNLKTFIKESYPERREELLSWLENGNYDKDYDIPHIDNFALIFNEEEEAITAKEAFASVFPEEILKLLIEPSHLCDCGCGIYVCESLLDPGLAKKGWHYHDCCGPWEVEQLEYDHD